MERPIELVTGKDYKRMIAGAYQAFLRDHEYINNLNVFPVPDGDTGTNMLMTLGAVARAVSEAPDSGIGYLSKKAADSAIMGARGNSGVILSQIFRGIARGLAGKEEATSAEVGKAFQYGVLYAYRAVSKPVEGTILTVAKGIAKGAHRAVREQVPFADILTEAVMAGREALKRTPDLLPALKQAGVVDAGGQGLITFLNGCLEGLQGIGAGPEAGVDRELVLNLPDEEEFDIARPYCTEFIVKGSAVGRDEARKMLSLEGDSLVLAEGDQVLKVHIHTAHPGAILEMALTWGTVHDIKIDNMADQKRKAAIPTQAKTALSIISVAAGDGFTAMMKKLGAHMVITGGQTMNPPVEEFVEAVHRGNAERYIILPNNKNIVLAANQVQKLLGDRVEIVPTVNIPQGLAALMAFDGEKDIAANVAAMQERVKDVNAAAVTIAVRDSIVDGRTVEAGRFIGAIGSKVIADSAELVEALVLTIKKLMTADTEVVSLYYGSEIHGDEAEALADRVKEQFPELEVEIYDGGQPLYHFIISAE